MKKLLLLPLMLAACLLGAQAAQTPRRVILHPSEPVVIRREHTVIRTKIPAGFRKVTVQVLSRASGRWVPRLSINLDGRGGRFRFLLNSRLKSSLIRLVADRTNDYPTYYSLTSPASGGVLNDGGFTLAATNAASPMLAAGAETSRAVEESDIWKIRGNTLYFFNQYRGLQVLDITNPDDPALTGQLRLPAVGEDMYLVGDHHAALLKHGWGLWSGSSESEVVIADLSTKSPTVAATLPVNGWTSDSRMVGNCLYVASSYYTQTGDDGHVAYENGTEVASFDLSDPATPVARGTMRFPGSNQLVTADSNRLFVVSYDWNSGTRSIVNVVDISDPSGVMTAGPAITVNGYIGDKFKLHPHGSVLTTVSQVWQWNNASGGNVQFSNLQNFDLARGGGEIASLKLASGDSLYATRFDGDRGYVVTFFQIDPLWVLDLADAAKPVISGHLQIPGYSNYIQPLGDRLVTIGYDGSFKTAVSLFDVRDPASPALLSQVVLGDGWTWSEAQFDEKAFGILPDAGLILVPFSGSTGGGWSSHVQLIDLNRDTLAKRGVINHRMDARRATLANNRVLSISATELLSVDASDRDNPAEKADVTLAWPVDRVIAAGGHLLQIGNSNPATLTVTSKTNTDAALSETALGNRPVVGAVVRGTKLYIAQADGDLTTTIYNISALPEVQLEGSASAGTYPGWAPDFDALWPGNSTTLVWVPRGNHGWQYWWQYPVAYSEGVQTSAGTLTATVADGSAASSVALGPLWWGAANESLFAFNVADPANPVFASRTDLSGAGNFDSPRYSFSDGVESNGAIMVSHRTSVYLADPVVTTGGGEEITVREGGSTKTSQWVTCDFLDVVNYDDPANATVSEPVNIPGEIKDATDNGAVLFTSGNDALDGFSVQASSFDGTAATLLDSVAIPGGWDSTLAVGGKNVFARSEGATVLLCSWRFGDNGKFVALGGTPLDSNTSSLRLLGNLLATSTWDGAITLFDVTNPGAPQNLGSHDSSGGFPGSLDAADGGLGDGLWIPKGFYGVENIDLSAP